MGGLESSYIGRCLIYIFTSAVFFYIYKNWCKPVKNLKKDSIILLLHLDNCYELKWFLWHLHLIPSSFNKKKKCFLLLMLLKTVKKERGKEEALTYFHDTEWAKLENRFWEHQCSLAVYLYKSKLFWQCIRRKMQNVIKSSSDATILHWRMIVFICSFV